MTTQNYPRTPVESGYVPVNGLKMYYPRVAQRDYRLARISLTSGVVHTVDLVAIMGRGCFPRDEMNATKRDLEVLR